MTNRFHQRSIELRKITESYYNYCQAVLVPYAEEAAMHIASNYGGEMKRAPSVAICGGLMDCADWLTVNKEAGREKKPHCDGMVYECVGLVYDVLKKEN